MLAAFTATATAQVQEDVVRQLDLRTPVRVVTGFDRPNLFFDVRRPRKKLPELLSLLLNCLYALDSLDKPLAQVKAVFELRLLCLLGYEADVYGLTGPDWQLSVNALANMTSTRLYKDLSSMDPSEALTREQAAQMLYNTLRAAPLVKTPNVQPDGTVDFIYQRAVHEDGTPATLLEVKFALAEFPTVPAQPGK